MEFARCRLQRQSSRWASARCQDTQSASWAQSMTQSMAVSPWTATSTNSWSISTAILAEKQSASKLARSSTISRRSSTAFKIPTKTHREARSNPRPSSHPKVAHSDGLSRTSCKTSVGRTPLSASPLRCHRRIPIQPWKISLLAAASSAKPQIPLRLLMPMLRLLIITVTPLRVAMVAKATCSIIAMDIVTKTMVAETLVVKAMQSRPKLAKATQPKPNPSKTKAAGIISIEKSGQP